MSTRLAIVLILATTIGCGEKKPAASSNAVSAVPDHMTVDEGGIATTLDDGATSVLANDTDLLGRPLTADTTPVTAPSHGTLTLDADGTFSYTHGDDGSTEDNFSYRVCDDSGTPVCAVGVVAIAVDGGNDAPAPADDAATVAEGGTITTLNSSETSVLANDSDPDGDSLTVTTTPVTAPSCGTLTLNADGTFSYTHGGGEETSDSFVYEACDAELCANATVTITVTPVNDLPVAADDTMTVGRGAFGTVLDSGAVNLLANDSDIEGNALALSTTAATAPTNGTVTLNADGTFLYTHDGSNTDTDLFVYEACDDGTPSACGTATVTVAIVNSNTPPVAGDDVIQVQEGDSANATTTGTSLLDNDTDYDAGDVLSVGLPAPTVAPLFGSLTLDTDGTFSYAHDGSETSADSFVYTVCDNGTPSLCASATVSIEIQLTNDPPSAGTDELVVDEGGTVTVTVGGETSLLTNDTDDDSTNLTISPTLLSDPTNGSVTVNADGTFSYTHDGSETTSDFFEYDLCDDGSPQACDGGIVNITINPVNDPPVAFDDAATVGQGGSTSLLDSGKVSLTANDSDAEDGVLTVTTTPTAAPSHGSVVLDADGTFLYTHDDSATNRDSFSYEVCDDASECVTAVVTIAITAANDAPIAVDDAIDVDEGAVATDLVGGATSLLVNDSDPDGGTLTAEPVPAVPPLYGTLSIASDGTFTYAHGGSEETADSFTYIVCDDGTPKLCAEATVDIVVNPIDDPVVAGADTYTGAIGNTDGVAGTVVPSTPHVVLTGPASLLDNDDDPDGPIPVVVAGTIATSNGGTVNVAADGTFIYTPPVAFEGDDDFTYNLVSGGSALVEITVTDMVWYVDNNTGAGTGRSSDPFGSTTEYNLALSSGMPPVPEDYVYIHEGAGPYDDGIQLLDSQQLIGQGVDFVLGDLVIAATNPPTLQPTAGTALSLAANNVVQGLNIDALDGSGIVGGGVGALVISSVDSVSAVGMGPAIAIDGGDGADIVIGAVSADNADGDGVLIENMVASSIVFGELNSAATYGAGLYVNQVNNLEIGGTASVVTATYGPALDINDCESDSGWVFANATSTESNSNALWLDNHDGALDIQGGDLTTSATASGPAVSMTGGSGDVTIAAPVTVVSGRSLQVSNRAGGTIDFTGDIDDSGAGILLENNTNQAIGFSGTLTLDTGAHRAFLARNSTATLTATGAGSTIAAGAATAIEIAGVSFGEGGFHIESVSTNGGPSGIRLVDNGSCATAPCFSTGANGVTPGQGGTITNTTGEGVWLENTGGISLGFLVISNTAGSAIHVPDGATVDGFTLLGSEVIDAGVHGINFGFGSDQLAGAALIDGVLISGAARHGVYLENRGGTATVTVTDTAIERLSGGTGLLLRGDGATGDLTVLVDVSSFTGIGGTGDAINLGVEAGATGVFTVSNTDFTNAGGLSTGDNAVRINGFGASSLDFNVHTNNISFFGGHSISVELDSGTVSGSIHNNTIQAYNAFSSSGVYVLLDAAGVSTSATGATVNIADNTISQTDGNGITVINRDDMGGATTLRTGIYDNTISAPLTDFAWGIEVRSDDANITCAAIAGNDSTGGGGATNGEDFRLGELGASTFELEGFTGTTLPEVVVYVDNANTGANTVSAVSDSGTITGFTSGVCAP